MQFILNEVHDQITLPLSQRHFCFVCSSVFEYVIKEDRNHSILKFERRKIIKRAEPKTICR